ncbi:MAG: NAD(P)-dependent oxidoreductase [Leptolyngbyaceae bacterium]|nr:NAD(P)-dependent oxidoreductase [Leptolyngbyaceae bacterium]
MNIGLIGTGLMGLPMALRLTDCGFSVKAYNRTPSKTEPLQRAGIPVYETVAELLAEVDCAVVMVTNAEAIADLLLAHEVKPQLSGKGIIQMSTIAPEQSRAIGEQISAAGGEYLEAPVLGSIPQAKDGTLIVMVGATPEQFETYQPVLQCFGSEPLHMGAIGTASATKLAMNQLIGSLTTAFALSLGMVQQAGIDVEQFMTIVRQSALYAPTFDKKLQRMCDRNFENPNFPTKHLLKDMALFAETAQHLGLDARLADSVCQIAQHALEQGFADADYSSLYAAVNPAS